MPAVAVAAALTFVAGCGGGGIDANEAATAEATVTQTAPSVWSPATSQTGPQPMAAAADADTTAAETGETLAGLSEECSNAVRAQTAVSTLFSDAIAQAPRPHTEEDEDVDAAALAISTAAAGEPITPETVAAVFTPLAAMQLPADIRDAFTVMRTAADDAVGKSAVEIAHILSADPAAAAMMTVTDYVQACRPDA